MQKTIPIPTYVAYEVHGFSARRALRALAPRPDAAHQGQAFAVEARGLITDCSLFNSGYTYWTIAEDGGDVCRLDELLQEEREAVGACVAVLDNDWEILEVFPPAFMEKFEDLRCPFVQVSFPDFIFFAALEDDRYTRPSALRGSLDVPGFVLLAEGKENALTPWHLSFLERTFGVSPQGPTIKV